MDKVIVNIGDKTYNCQLAKNDEDRRKGLMDIEFLPPDEGVLDALLGQNIKFLFFYTQNRN